MHYISDNIYLINRVNPLASYTLDRFLHNELAIERAVGLNDIRLGVYNVLLSHGFHLQLNGCEYLALLASRYIVKSDYNEQKAISDIAIAIGANDDFIVGCINASIIRNKEFIPIASKTLGVAIPSDKTSITDVVAIIGAVFKIYFNYTVDSEHFDEDDCPAINFSRAILDHGEKR
ncbi:MAG: hypothetical protein K2M47_03420 [Clostridiales bacterium]|nr:hypothetical protein [Clostridiales bacterium]